MKGLRQAKRYILKARDIVISGHINPDGDSLGSLLSLSLGLESIGKKVYSLSQDKIPTTYSSLPGINRLAKTTNKKVDIAIAVDCSTKELLSKTFSVFKRAKAILEIDHHEFRRPFGDIRLIDHKAAAVGELVYMLLKELNVKITKDIAENLLTSIIVETNSFRLNNVRPFTFRLCAQLLEYGVDFPKLVDIMYWSRTRESVILSGLCLARSKFLANSRLMWSIIRAKDYAKIKGRDYDADAVANEMRAIKGVEIAVLFREENKKRLRVSLRSKGEINIASIAEKYGGGGHFDTAGCYIPNDTKSIKEILFLADSLLE
jgi:phosphoesterase RecJ-like protein